MPKKAIQRLGSRFQNWIDDVTMGPYNCFGSGSAMWVSSVAWFSDDESRVIEPAQASAEMTHDHPEEIKGVQAMGCRGHRKSGL